MDEESSTVGTSGFRTALLELAGTILLAFGIIGIFLPILPTTPFVIAAAFCFSANPRVQSKIVNSPFFGDYIRGWKEKRPIPFRSRVQGILLVWATLTIGMVFFMKEDWLRALLIIVGICVTIHLLTICRGGKGPSERSR